ncbi:Retrovirus-related Pol polyprotein from transposon TNT 1-94 [Anthophora retusa]
MYLAVATRPDISHVVSTLAQFNDCNGEAHWVAAKRVLRYLKGTINYSINYRKSDDCLQIYVDADWGRCKMDRRSYTGYVTTLSNGPISWKSTKQRAVALSSTEAEYVALAEAVKDGIYFSEFLKELGFCALSKMTVYNDNLGAQLLAKNPIVHPRTKHINIRFHFLRDVFKRDNFKLEYLSFENMPADVLTKPLPRDKHYFCIERMGIV